MQIDWKFDAFQFVVAFVLKIALEVLLIFIKQRRWKKRINSDRFFTSTFYREKRKSSILWEKVIKLYDLNIVFFFKRFFT